MQTQIKQLNPVIAQSSLQTRRYHEPSVSIVYAYWSRTIDIFFGICGTFVVLLVLPLLALAIFLDSPGPIFYSQERLGKQGRLFRIYKFRSMKPSNSGHVMWAQAGDSRVTRVGRILRPTHMDELPQVWNILRGDMSMIGPRPELPAFSQELERSIPGYNHRIVVKPGLTGLAQVSHTYGDTTEDERIKLNYDLQYIQNRSIALDIKIIFKTVSEVMFGHGR